LSSTVVGKRFWLRACIINPRAQIADMHRVLAVVADSGKTELNNSAQ
jgi:hypothetical protein